jgi:osmotically-inducible protein OsmY
MPSKISPPYRSVESKEELAREVSKVKGVKKVENQLLVMKRYGV